MSLSVLQHEQIQLLSLQRKSCPVSLSDTAVTLQHRRSAGSNDVTAALSGSTAATHPLACVDAYCMCFLSITALVSSISRRLSPSGLYDTHNNNGSQSWFDVMLDVWYKVRRDFRPTQPQNGFVLLTHTPDCVYILCNWRCRTILTGTAGLSAHSSSMVCVIWSCTRYDYIKQFRAGLLRKEKRVNATQSNGRHNSSTTLLLLL